MLRCCQVLLIASVLSPVLVSAQGLALLPDRGDGHLTFYLDNDLFAGTDENYTNGVRLSWISGARDPKEFGLVQNWLRELSGDDESLRVFQKISGFENPAEVEYNYGFSITQFMFTPKEPKSRVSPPGQRPYAGWLGVGFSLHTKDARALNSAELALGATGRWSLAEPTQDFVHDLRGFEKFSGWDSQIPTEPTINFYYKQKRRFNFLEVGRSGFAVDGFGEWRVALGNFLTDLQLGALMRFGWHLPVDFSDPRLTVTAYTHQPFKIGPRQPHAWSFYGLAGALGAAVAHNITLDGPVFKNYDTGVSSEPLVGELYAGFGIQYHRLQFSYVHTFRTREFRQQQAGQKFGSFALSYRLRF
jgi:hypothetical protein